MSDDLLDLATGGNINHKQRNEFIVGGDEISETPFVSNHVLGGEDEPFMGGEDEPFMGGEDEPFMGGDESYMSGGRMLSLPTLLIVALLIIGVIVLLSNMGGSRRRVNKPNLKLVRQYKPPHHVAFDHVLIPPSYFDYKNHGREYINWK
jgi:hypothetical protein